MKALVSWAVAEGVHRIWSLWIFLAPSIINLSFTINLNKIGFQDFVIKKQDHGLLSETKIFISVRNSLVIDNYNGEILNINLYKVFGIKVVGLNCVVKVV